jgi:hypothetical protein
MGIDLHALSRPALGVRQSAGRQVNTAHYLRHVRMMGASAIDLPRGDQDGGFSCARMTL